MPSECHLETAIKCTVLVACTLSQLICWSVRQSVRRSVADYEVHATYGDRPCLAKELKQLKVIQWAHIDLNILAKNIVIALCKKMTLFILPNLLLSFLFLVESHNSKKRRVRPSVRPLVRWCVHQSVHPAERPSFCLSITSFFGGQKRRRRTNFAVYTALFFSVLTF